MTAPTTADYEAPEWVVWVKRMPSQDILTYKVTAPSIDAALHKASREHRAGFRENSFQLVLAAKMGLEGVTR